MASEQTIAAVKAWLRETNRSPLPASPYWCWQLRGNDPWSLPVQLYSRLDGCAPAEDDSGFRRYWNSADEAVQSLADAWGKAIADGVWP